MTKNVVSYNGKSQIININIINKNYRPGPRSEKWSEIKTTLFQNKENGYVITGICYNHGLKEYLIVFTESTASQNYKWFKPSEDKERNIWEANEYYEFLRHPTIYFRDPNYDELLVVCISDENRSSYNSSPGFPLVEH